MFNAVNPGSILLIALVLLLTVFGVRKYRRNKAARLEERKQARSGFRLALEKSKRAFQGREEHLGTPQPKPKPNSTSPMALCELL